MNDFSSDTSDSFRHGRAEQFGRKDGNMINGYKPVLIGFEKASANNAVLEHLAIASDLGGLLSEHLLIVFRQQYNNLVIESMEFVGADNCNAEGVSGIDPHIIAIDTLSIPFKVNLIINVRHERYHLGLHVTLNAKRTGQGYDLKSDVRILSQVFLGAS